MHFPSLPRLSVVAALMLTGACSDQDLLGGTPEVPQQQDVPAQPLQTAALVPVQSRLSTSIGQTPFGQDVADAVRSHPDVRASTADINVAQAELLSASGALRPDVSVGAQAEQSLRNSSGSGITPYLRVSQLIYDGGASRAEKAAATSVVQQTTSTRLVTASAVSLNAVEAYLNVLTARSQLEVMEDNLARHREILEQIESRRSAGAGLETDVLTARSRLADAETRAIEARLALASAEASYTEIFGDPPGAAMPQPPQAPDLPASQQAVIDNSPRMRALNAELAATEARLELVRASRRPRLEVGANAQHQNGEGDVVFDLSVGYSFDTRRELQAAENRAIANVQRLLAEKTALGRNILRALENARSEAVAGAARLRTARAAVEASRENVAAAQDEFSIGRRSLLELLEAQRDYIQARSTVIDAERQQVLTGYEALALTGDIVGVFGISFLELSVPVLDTR